MYTFNAKIHGKSIQIKALKADAERIARKLAEPLDCPKSWKEITNFSGEDYTSVLYSPFGPGEGQIKNLEEYHTDIEAFYNSLPELLDMETALPFIAKARELYQKHLPTVDKRESPEDRKARLDKVDQIQKNQADEKQAWLDKYCGAPVKLPAGMMFVTLQYTYDDSDSMSDYFDRHCRWGETMIIGIVPVGPEREATARKIIDQYPELKKLDWSWHNETWSMGHGNYLIATTDEHAEDVKTYGGYSNPGLTLEVQFNKWDKELPTWKNYKVSEPAKETTGTMQAGVTYERDWTWIKYPAKPTEDKLEALHALGARFSGKRMAWYLTSHIEASQLNAVL